MTNQKDTPDHVRRKFLQGAAAGAGAAALGLINSTTLADERASAKAVADWDAGSLAHILPAASHEQLLLKCSFAEPQKNAPVLHVGEPGRARTEHGQRRNLLAIPCIRPQGRYDIHNES